MTIKYLKTCHCETIENRRGNPKHKACRITHLINLLFSAKNCTLRFLSATDCGLPLLIDFVLDSYKVRDIRLSYPKSLRLARRLSMSLPFTLLYIFINEFRK